MTSKEACRLCCQQNSDISHPQSVWCPLKNDSAALQQRLSLVESELNAYSIDQIHANEHQLHQLVVCEYLLRRQLNELSSSSNTLQENVSPNAPSLMAGADAINDFMSQVNSSPLSHIIMHDNSNLMMSTAPPSHQASPIPAQLKTTCSDPVLGMRITQANNPMTLRRTSQRNTMSIFPSKNTFDIGHESDTEYMDFINALSGDIVLDEIEDEDFNINAYSGYREPAEEYFNDCVDEDAALVRELQELLDTRGAMAESLDNNGERKVGLLFSDDKESLFTNDMMNRLREQLDSNYQLAVWGYTMNKQLEGDEGDLTKQYVAQIEELQELYSPAPERMPNLTITALEHWSKIYEIVESLRSDDAFTAKLQETYGGRKHIALPQVFDTIMDLVDGDFHADLLPTIKRAYRKWMWTDCQDRLFIMGLDTFGEYQYEKIIQHLLPYRTVSQITTRFKNQCKKKTLVKNDGGLVHAHVADLRTCLTKDAETALVEGVEKYGQDFHRISRLMVYRKSPCALRKNYIHWLNVGSMIRGLKRRRSTMGSLDALDTENVLENEDVHNAAATLDDVLNDDDDDE